MGADATAWLTGRIRDGAGQGMSPAAARRRGGKRYRYYVSQGLQQGRIRRDRGEAGGQRIPAPLIEARVAEILHRLDLPGAEVAWPCLQGVEIHEDHILLIIEHDTPSVLRDLLIAGEVLDADPQHPGALRLRHEMRLQRRQYRLEAVAERSHPDPALIAALRKAHAQVQYDRNGLPTCDGAPTTPYARKRLQLAFLAPDLQRDILLGRQPPGLTLARLLTRGIPPDWDEQRRMIRDLAVR